jgi:putative acetyltransferase
MAVEFEIAPARWPQDIGQARAMLMRYGQFLSDSPVGSAGVCLIGYTAELDSLPGKYNQDDADLFLARSSGEAAGCVAVSKRVLPDGRLAAEMKRLWTEPAFRGHGLGRALVEAAIAWAQSQGCVALVLDTVQEAMPEASALYRSLGFKETGRFNDNPISGVQFYILKIPSQRLSSVPSSTKT